MTKRRLCIIGTSHIAAIKSGLSLLPALSDVEVDFFGATSGVFAEFRFDGSRLLPTSEETAEAFRSVSGGKESVELGAYDSFMVCGFAGSSIGMQVRRTCRTTSMTVDHQSVLVSEALFKRAVIDRLLGQVGVQLAIGIRARCDARVFVAQRPCYAESNQESVPGRIHVARRNDRSEVFRLHSLACRELSQMGLDYLQQPAETLSASCLTRAEYSVGSRRLLENDLHGSADSRHMNGEYGKLVLQGFLTALGISQSPG